MAEIERLKAECAAGRNPARCQGAAVGQEIVNRFHGPQASEDALADFVNAPGAVCPTTSPR